MKYSTTGFIIICLIAILLFQVGSCTPQGCLEETEALVKGSFYKTGTGKIQTPDSVTLYGLGRDTSKIYNSQKNTSSIRIPLYAGSDTCILILKINGIADTLTFYYTSYPHLISKECGYTFFHSLDNIANTREEVDILIINRNISTVNEENIRIFY